ncbi:hypothetical protein AB4G91_02985 [Macrococcoides goetzii]
MHILKYMIMQYTYLLNVSTSIQLRIKSSEGFIFPSMLILLMLTILFLSYFSTRYMLKFNTLDNLEHYYFNEIIEAISQKK